MTQQRQSGLLLLGLAYLGFISIGLPDGLLGVAWPSIRAYFQLSLDALGPFLVVFTTGYVLSSFGSGRILSHLNVGTLLALSCLMTAISLLRYALAPFWWLMVALASLAGLGAGAIDAGVNAYAATHHSARTLNWLHACYGVGAASGPILMTAVIGANLPWQWGYGLVGVGQLALATCFGLTRRHWPAPQSPSTPTGNQVVSSLQTLRLPATWLSIAAFFVYTGVEAAVGAWTYSLLTEVRMVPMHTAGLWVSIYWGSLTVGRLLCGLIVNHMPIDRLLRFCIVSVSIGTALIWSNVIPSLSFLGLALVGLAAGPIFPSLIATTPQRLGIAHTANGIGFHIAAAALGQSLLPTFVGVLANRMSLEIVGPFLFVAAVLLFITHALLIVVSDRETLFQTEAELIAKPTS
jgi:fucose permease